MENKETVEETIANRKDTHGPWIEGSALSQMLKRLLSINKDTRCNSANEALDRICMKLSRIVVGNSYEPDHWHDIAGYATLVEKDLKEVEKDLKETK